MMITKFVLDEENCKSVINHVTKEIVMKLNSKELKLLSIIRMVIIHLVQLNAVLILVIFAKKKLRKQPINKGTYSQDCTSL